MMNTEWMLGALIPFAGVAAWAFAFSWFRVEEGHMALVTSFGAPVGGSNGEGKLYSPGLYRKLPWQKKHEFSKMERVMRIGGEKRSLEVLARDGTLLRVDGRARFKFSPERATSFLFGVKDPIRHLEESFRGIAAEEIGRFGSQETPSGNYAELREKREDLNRALARRGDELRDRYGIDFRALDLAEILPPADLADALNGIQKVKTQFETLQKRVEAECARKVVASEHGVEIARTRAEAVEREITVLGEMLDELENKGTLEAYLRRRRDEASLAARSVYMKS